MRFNCGPNRSARKLAKEQRAANVLAARREWAALFAWRPVQTDAGTCVWLEMVQRRWHPRCDEDYMPASLKIAIGRWEYRILALAEGGEG